MRGRDRKGDRVTRGNAKCPSGLEEEAGVSAGEMTLDGWVGTFSKSCQPPRIDEDKQASG